jgi:hypothetical protein
MWVEGRGGDDAGDAIYMCYIRVKHILSCYILYIYKLQNFNQYILFLMLLGYLTCLVHLALLSLVKYSR